MLFEHTNRYKVWLNGLYFISVCQSHYYPYGLAEWPVFYESMLHPDVFWYCLNGMGAQKKCAQKSSVTLFPYIFHVKTIGNIVYEYLKTKIFSRDTNTLPQMH